MNQPIPNGDQPAFPCEIYDTQPHTGEQVVRGQEFGLTKREEFAKAAMVGLLASPCEIQGTTVKEIQQKVGSLAASYADALLAELEKKP